MVPQSIRRSLGARVLSSHTVRLCAMVAAVILSLSLSNGLALAQTNPSGLSNSDMLSHYKDRRVKALTIQQELSQRVAQFERQIANANNTSNDLQRRLGTALRQEKEMQNAAVRLQADIAGKDDFLNQARGRIASLQAQQRDLQARIAQAQRDEPKRKAMCAIPFYGWFKCLDDLVKGWDRDIQRMSRDVEIAQKRIDSTEQERQVAEMQLHKLQQDLAATAAERGRLQVSIGETEQQLVTVHAALADNYTSLQRYNVSLDGFSAELAQIETLQAEERASVIARRLTRLDAQLITEMGNACQLFVRDEGQLPAVVTQACSPA